METNAALQHSRLCKTRSQRFRINHSCPVIIDTASSSYRTSLIHTSALLWIWTKYHSGSDPVSVLFGFRFRIWTWLICHVARVLIRILIPDVNEDIGQVGIVLIKIRNPNRLPGSWPKSVFCMWTWARTTSQGPDPIWHSGCAQRLLARILICIHIPNVDQGRWPGCHGPDKNLYSGCGSERLNQGLGPNQHSGCARIVGLVARVLIRICNSMRIQNMNEEPNKLQADVELKHNI